MARYHLPLIAALGFGYCLFVFYPGIVVPDAAVQLNEARSGDFRDWHPPLMAALWRWLLPVSDGPLPLLILHLGLYWGSWLLLACSHPQRRGWGYAMVALGFAPFLINLSGVLIKDVGMAVSWLSAMALGYYLQQRRQRSVIAALVMMVLLFYGLAIRANALFAVLPLLAWGMGCWLREWRRLALGTCIAYLLLVALVPVVNYHWLQAQRSYPLQYLMVADLTALSLVNNRLLFPPEYLAAQPPLTLERLAEYDAVFPEHINNFYFNEPSGLFNAPWGEPLLGLIRDPAAYRALRDYWLATIATHPGSYLHHRWTALLRLLRLREEGDFYVVFPPAVPFSESVRDDDGSIHWQRLLAARPATVAYLATLQLPLQALARSGLFHGWVWLLLGVVATGVALGRWRRPLTATTTLASALLASAALYGAPYFIVVPAVDYRYLYWPVMAVAVAGLLLWGERRGGGLASGRAAAG